MKKSLLFIALLMLAYTLEAQNTLNNLGLSASSPAQVAYGLRQLSTSYTGSAIKVRRAVDNAEATVAFDASLTPGAVSESSIVTLETGVTVATGLGSAGTGTISTTVSKTGTISIAVNRTGTISVTIGTNVVSGSGTSFGTDIKVGDLLYRSDNIFVGIVKTINSPTSLILQNNTVIGVSAAAFKTKDATVTGSGTSFTTQLAVGDRIYNSSSNAYLGTVSLISSNVSMTLNARDAVAASGVGFVGTSNVVTGSGTSFNTQLSIGQMLIGNNNVTLGIIASIESATSLTLTLNTKAGSALTAQSFKFTAGSMAFSAFCGSSDVFVNTWYDQSGNGRDAVQFTAANQPRLVTAGTLNRVPATTGRPSIEFNIINSTGRFLQTLSPASYLNNTLYTQNIVSAEVTPVSNYQFVLSTSGGAGPTNTVMHYGYRSSSQYTVAQYGNDVNLEVYATNSLELHTAIKNATNSSRFYHNGAYLGQLSFASTALMSDLGLLNIGNYTGTNTNIFYKGSVSELTVYALAMGSDVTALNSNQSSYYGVNSANWVGGNSGNPNEWNEPNNWSPATVPTASSPSMVVIPNGRANYPIITSGQTYAVMNITTESVATLTVQGTLQVFGTLLNTAANRINASNGTIEYKSTSAQSILANTFTNNTVNNLIINNTNSAVVAMGGNLTISNNLAFPTGSTGKLALSSVLTLGGTVTNNNALNSGLRGSSNGNLVVTGLAELRFDQSTPCSTNLLRTLVINGSSAVATLASNLSINNNATGLTFTNGKLAIGSNTLTLIGDVVNTVAGGLRGSANSNLIITGTTNRTLSFDQTTPGTTNLLTNFSINTTSANTITAANAFSVNGTFTVDANQTLNMGTNALGGTMTTVAHSGTLNTQNISSTPIPSGKTWGGSVSYNSASTAQTAIAGAYNNLSIATTGGATASGDITVNGVLSLATNPNETNGALEMTKIYGDYSNIFTPVIELTTRRTAACDILDSYILTMGGSATFTGSGDVTGRVKRTTLLANTEYSFGSPFSTITFSSGGTMPSAVMFVITKGSDRGRHANLETTLNRLYQVIQTGGSGNTFALKLKYMDSELNGNSNENNLVLWDHHIPYGTTNTPHQHGKTSQNISENWVSLSGHAISYLATSETIGGFSKYWMINTAGTNPNATTWLGANFSDPYNWNELSNWTNGVPTATKDAIIPLNASHLPTLAATSVAKTITIENGAVLNGGTGTTLTISGGALSNGGVGSWNNAGTFNPGTSTVNINFSGATISGTTDFNNLTILTDTSALTPQSGTIMRIGGTLDIIGNGKLNTYLFNNTVEYNGAAQNVKNPAGISTAYRNLILSGSGTKTLPSSPLSILGAFTVAGTASAAATNSLDVNGILTIGSGTTFTAGSYTHYLQDDFVNNGTFSGNGSTMAMNGTSAQSIGGTQATTFNNLTIDNAAGVSLGNNLVTTLSGNLIINNGKKLTIDDQKKLTVNGNLTNNAGNGGLVINTGGSLITNGNATGGATVLRTIAADEWHLISSPVSNAVSGIFTDQYLQTHDEVSNLYSDILPTDVTLSKLKGYALWTVNNPFTAQFEGTLNTGDQNIATTKINEGWNLVGNPYPSSIDWTQLTKTNIKAAVYMHVDASKWATYVEGSGVNTNGGSQYIPPCQGFFVEADGSGSLGMTNSARTHTTNQFFKSGENTTAHLVRLQVSGNGYSDEAVVALIPGSTTDFDGNFDARKLFGYIPEAAQIYTLGTSELSINSLPEAKTVPVGLQAGANGDYTIEATEINDIGALTLEDKAKGIFTDLMSDSYTFNFIAGKTEDRFVLHFGTLSVEENTPSILADIYSYQKTVYIKLNDRDDCDIYIYNMAGQAVAGMASATGMVSINVNSSGIYIVKVVTKNGIQTQKIFIQ